MASAESSDAGVRARGGAVSVGAVAVVEVERRRMRSLWTESAAVVVVVVVVIAARCASVETDAAVRRPIANGQSLLTWKWVC